MSGGTTIKKRYIINHRIRAPKLRVILEDGENLGVIDKGEALRQAQSRDLDLVLIAENANPPVAKILDFKKFLYETRKKASSSKAKSKKSELKEFRFGPSIGKADLTQRIERAKGFIEDKNRVKVTIKMRGRENDHPDVGFEKINTFVEELKEIAVTEENPKRTRNLISVVFVAK